MVFARMQGEIHTRMKSEMMLSDDIDNDHTLRLLALPRVELEPRQTMFWRHQKGKPREYLATIEVHIFSSIDCPLLPPKLQRRGLVYKGKMVTVERV